MKADKQQTCQHLSFWYMYYKEYQIIKLVNSNCFGPKWLKSDGISIIPQLRKTNVPSVFLKRNGKI